MLKQILTIAVLFISFSTYAQYGWCNVEVHLKDGKVLNGEAKLRMQSAGINIGNKDVLLYRTNKKAKKQKFEPKKVEYVLFTVAYKEKINKRKVEKTRIEKYIPVAFNLKRNKYGFVELIVEGDLRLVGRTISVQNGSYTGPPAAGAGVPLNTTPTYVSYTSRHNELMLLKEGNEPVVFNQLSLTKSFKKRAAEYFKSCPSLVNKIENKDFGKEDLIAITEYYNSNCGL